MLGYLGAGYTNERVLRCVHVVAASERYILGKVSENERVQGKLASVQVLRRVC